MLEIDPDDPNGHVLMASFGRDVIDQRTRLSEFQESAPMMRPVIAEIATRTLYDETYGICDHMHVKDDPLSLVGYHPKEDLYEGSMVAMMIRDFYRYSLAEGFGISLIEFMDLPLHVTEDIIRVAKAGQEAKSKAMADIKKDYK